MRWKREFSFIIIVTATLSGIAYSFQEYYFDNLFEGSRQETRLNYNIIRSIRMFSLYVIPSIWFVFRWRGNINSLGLIPPKRFFLINIVLGIFLYAIAAVVFVRNEIFFGSWASSDWNEVWKNFILVAIMASITDFWTRGFILFELARRTSDANAIFWQNVTWFVIHIYEIELLIPYIGLVNSILLTLILGIGGDVVALKTKSILGLMLGHIFLNLAILLAAKDVIILF